MSSPSIRDHAAPIPGRWLVIGGTAAIVLTVLLGVVIAARGIPFGFDSWWMARMLDVRNEAATGASFGLNFLGGGWFSIFVVPLGGALLFILLGRRWTGLFFVLALALSAGGVQLLKHLFLRARPEDIIVVTDAGSFPSGHVANAATLAVAVGLLLRRGWIWAVGIAYVVIMALSRTYLGAHWVSDTVGGALLGAAIAALVWVPLSNRMRAERAPDTL